ncbi:MAG: hypothetical protein U5K43_04475 [Halofilum sp. (in: g-proteobacteria)]|nr:hypothetical protein [Halofilum sp. (in: g-proteobacteria)]
MLIGLAVPLHADERGIEGEGGSASTALEPEGVPPASRTRSAA